MIKSYIGISRDHSGSMGGISKAAMNDYNSKITSIKNATIQYSQDTVISVVECSSDVKRVVTNSNIISVQPISSYRTGGMTALWDSVGDLIEQFENMPDAKDPNVSFLIMAITDGAENGSHRWSASRLGKKIKELTMSDQWTFVFRIPRGHAYYISSLGIPEGNIQEWDQTERGVQEASAVDNAAFGQYFTVRASGVRSTDKFYTDLSNVTVSDVKKNLTDISAQLLVMTTGDTVVELRPFIVSKMNQWKTGASFYQLTKTEHIQSNKKIIIRDKKSNKCYSGHEARHMLGLPDNGTIKVTPGSHGKFDIFVQSNSVNRKLMPNTEVLYAPTI